VTQPTATETTTDWYGNLGIHVQPAAAAWCEDIREAAHPWIAGVAHPLHRCNSGEHYDAPHVCDCGFYWPHQYDAACSTCRQIRPVTQLRAGRGVKANDPLLYTCVDPAHADTGCDGNGPSATVDASAEPPLTEPTAMPREDVTASLYLALGIVSGLLALAEQAEPGRPPSVDVFSRHLGQIKTIITGAATQIAESQRHYAADQVVRALAPAFTRGPAAGRVGHLDVS